MSLENLLRINRLQKHAASREAVRLAGRGHEVRVVTAPPYYPQWRVADPNRWR